MFWQVHPAAADVLAGVVSEVLRPQPGDVALDLYCGAGLFAGTLAAAVGPSGEVIGIESDRAAVRDARHNLRDTPWARIHRGDVAEVLGQAQWDQASLAVLDPPRVGVARPALDELLRPDSALRRVAYVSCDPATLARDIAVFAEAGWELGALRAFDAFPMTHHVECVATLTRGLASRAAQRSWPDPPGHPGWLRRVRSARRGLRCGARGRRDLLVPRWHGHLERGQVGRDGREPAEVGLARPQQGPAPAGRSPGPPRT